MTNRDLKTAHSWSIKNLESKRDDTKIRYAERRRGTAGRRILFLNGRSEWIEKYADLPAATAFSEDSHWVTMDHRGQGDSGGTRAHVRSFDDFAEDLAQVIDYTFGNEPFYLLAHSMGSLIGAYATLTQKIKPSGLFLCSPLFGMLMPMPLWAGRIVAGAIAHSPWSTLSTGAGTERRASFVNNPLTHSEPRFECVVNSPYPPSPPTFGWVHAALQAIDTVHKASYLRELRIPVSIIVGENEAVVDSRAYAGWGKAWQKATGMKLDLTVIPEARHELLNEADTYRDQAIRKIDETLRF